MAVQNNYNYSVIENPYNNQLARENADGVFASSSADSIGGNAPSGQEVSDVNNIPPTIPINGNDLEDLWVKRWIKSKNYKPGIQGFFIDGLTGEIEANNIFLYSNKANAIIIDHGGNILLKDGGNINFVSVLAPTACSATLVNTATGNVDNGDHRYKITFVNNSGETELGVVSNLITADATHKQVNLTNIPISSSNSVSKRKIYRFKAADPDNYFLLTTIDDNITTTFTDNVADASLTGDVYNEKPNNTFGKIFVDNNVSLSIKDNTYIGWNSGSNTTTGVQNVGVGKYTLLNNNVGSYNVAVGQGSLQNSTNAPFNTSIGTSSMFNTTEGGGCSSLGFQALFSNTMGAFNHAFGANTLALNTTGNYNIAIGLNSLYYSTTASYNIGIGISALYKNTIGTENTALGFQSLYFNTTGSYNTAIGLNSGLNDITGSSNIFVGHSAGKYSTESNKLYVDNQDRTNTAGDKAKALIYGVFASASADQDLTFNADVYTKHHNIKSVQTNITAYASGGQANAVQITNDIVEISICATAGDSVKLPTAEAGLEIKITNHGVASCDVFPNSSDAINEAAADTAKALAVNATMLCVAYDATNWECLTLAR